MVKQWLAIDPTQRHILCTHFSRMSRKSNNRILRCLILALALLLGGTAPGVAEASCSSYLSRFHSEAELKLAPNEVAIFGYGSLLNLESLSRTLNHEYEGPVAIARLSNWSRAWTALYPNNNRYRANGPDSMRPKDILYLNIEPRDGGVINGAVIVVTREEINLLDQRELTYDRKDVTDSLQDLHVSGGRVYTYVAKPEFTARPGMRYPQVGIRETYFGMVNSVLPHYGNQFAEEFNNSTIEAPPETLFSDVAD